MTAKSTKTKPARRTKGTASAQPQERTVTIPFPDTDSEDEANRILARDVPGWDKLDKDERAELLQLIRDHRKRGTPAKVKLIRKPDGGWSIEPAGKSEMLAVLKLHETFSANSIDPVNARANELLKYLGSVGADNEGRYNAALSFIESMKPQDQAEALLLVQMYCTHDAAIRGAEQRKMRINPMEPEVLASAPRCLATTRKGTACQSPAVKGRKRCRMHGGTNPGAPKGNQNARKHGGYSAKTLEAVRYVKAMARLVRDRGC